MRFLRWKRGQLTAKICDPTRTKMSLRRNFGSDVDTPISALRWHIEDFDSSPVNPAAATTTGGGGAGTTRFRLGGTASREASKTTQRPAQGHSTPRGRKYEDGGGGDGDGHAEGVDDDGGLPRHLGGRLLGGEAVASEEDVHERLQREKTDALGILDRVLGRTSASTIALPATVAASSEAKLATPAPPTMTAGTAAPSEEDKARFVAIKQPLRQLFQAPTADESSSGAFFLLGGRSAGDDDADSDDSAEDGNDEPAPAVSAARAPISSPPGLPAHTSFFSFGNLLTRCVAASSGAWHDRTTI